MKKSILLLLTVLSISCQEKSKISKPTLLYADKETLFKTLKLTIYQDSSFIYKSTGLVTTTTYFGQAHIKNDTVHLIFDDTTFKGVKKVVIENEKLKITTNNSTELLLIKPSN